jgi:Raf kinase inhibitor-like YbhB/YbcL family protein
MRSFVLAGLVLGSFLGGCSSSKPACSGGNCAAPDAQTTPTAPAVFSAGSSAFIPGGSIPQQYTCDGTNISPPLEWSDAPASTAQVALIMEDLDADAPGGTFVHWVIWGLPATGSVAAGAPPSTAIEGVNGSGRRGYTGPCPPSAEHHYRFTFYALSRPPNVQAGATATQLRHAINATTVAASSFIGTYLRG